MHLNANLGQASRRMLALIGLTALAATMAASLLTGHLTGRTVAETPTPIKPRTSSTR
jgi:hypothetical protein